VPIHREGSVVRILFQNIQGDVHHRKKTAPRFLKSPPELTIPVSIGDDLDLLDMSSVGFDRRV
jgi:hypothetical protein